MRDFYPVSFVKTSKLDSSRNYVFGYHPNGMIPEGLAVSFASEALQFSKTFPGIVPYIGARARMLFSDHSKYRYSRIIWQGSRGKFVLSDWFFLGRDFDIQTLSMETVISHVFFVFESR